MVLWKGSLGFGHGSVLFKLGLQHVCRRVQGGRRATCSVASPDGCSEPRRQPWQGWWCCQCSGPYEPRSRSRTACVRRGRRKSALRASWLEAQRKIQPGAGTDAANDHWCDPQPVAGPKGCAVGDARNILCCLRCTWRALCSAWYTNHRTARGPTQRPRNRNLRSMIRELLLLMPHQQLHLHTRQRRLVQRLVL
jgi:hypothetical protein